MAFSLGAFLNSLLPGRCVLCHAASRRPIDLCRPCERDLPWLGHSCRRCALPLEDAGISYCSRCQWDPPPFDGMSAAFAYEFPVDRLILEFKNRGDLIPGMVLAHLLAQRLADDAAELPDCLIPVPLHPARQRTRGFNQAMEIALVLSQRLKVPVEGKSCRRTVNTSSQQTLSAQDRIGNVMGSFKVAAGITAERVAIVDDVVTTGGTVRELTSELLAAGVDSVRIWAVARTLDLAATVRAPTTSAV